MGRAYLGIGSGSGKDRVIKAVQSAVAIRLQDVRINNATSVMLYVKAKHEVTIEEIDRAAVLVREAVHKDANIIFGFDFRDDLPHDVEIMLIATGFGVQQNFDRVRPAAEPRRHSQRRSAGKARTSGSCGKYAAYARAYRTKHSPSYGRRR